LSLAPVFICFWLRETLGTKMTISQDDTVPGVQAKVVEFCKRFELDADIASRLLDLQSEVGELAKEALRRTEYGKKPFSPSSEWENELGDILFSLTCLANQSGTNLASALSQALRKYQNRWDKKGSISSDSS
jgi:NTP pyrophosphatase (non-canonical NTP hydrolase)